MDRERNKVIGVGLLCLISSQDFAKALNTLEYIESMLDRHLMGVTF